MNLSDFLNTIGTSGHSGYSGASGVGFSGYSGISGYSGTKGTTELSFSIPTTLATNTGTMRWYFDGSATISNVLASVGVAPTGASVIFDVNKNDTTIFTNQANRPTITASNFYDFTSTPDVTSLTSGDYLTIDVDQIGSTIAGSNAIIRIKII